jgi:hypothetical protein
VFDLKAAEPYATAEESSVAFMDVPARARDTADSLTVTRVESLGLVIVSKSRAGFRASEVQALRRLVAEIASGEAGACKFLVLDFAHRATGAEDVAPGFDDLLNEAASLILEVPVLLIAWARGPLSGTDLEVALACSMIVGEQGARFSFATDLVDRFRSYAILAHKIGFAKAERLMEGGETLDAAEMLNHLLLKEVAPPTPGYGGIERFVQTRWRRHNSSCGIYRAQRIAMGPL